MKNAYRLSVGVLFLLIIWYNINMKKIWMNKTHSFRDAEDFNIKFWRNASAAAKFSALWQMVEEFYKIRNKRGYKLRLQRSVQNIKQA